MFAPLAARIWYAAAAFGAAVLGSSTLHVGAEDAAILLQRPASNTSSFAQLRHEGWGAVHWIEPTGGHNYWGSAGPHYHCDQYPVSGLSLKVLPCQDREHCSTYKGRVLRTHENGRLEFDDQGVTGVALKCAANDHKMRAFTHAGEWLSE